MKKAVLLCTMLAALCFAAYANEITDLGAVDSKDVVTTEAQKVVVPDVTKADGTPLNTAQIKYPADASKVRALPVMGEAFDAKGEALRAEIARLEAELALAIANGSDVSGIKAALDELYKVMPPTAAAGRLDTPPANDLCADAIALTVPANVTGTTIDATGDTPPAPSYCGTSLTAPGVWYTVIGTGNTITVETCGSNYDTKLFVYCLDCANLACVGGNDDACGLQSRVIFCSAAGTVYRILVSGYSSATGDFVLAVTDDGVACSTPPECTPPPPPPANDLCADAEALTLPASVQGNTLQATDDNTLFCGTSAPGKGVWYTVVGDGNTLTATTCNDYTDFDTKIQVWCGNCDELICVAGNDDFTCSFGGLLSTVTWCSEAGTVYYVLMGGYFSNAGNFQLDITSDGVACDGAIPCCIVDLTLAAPGTVTGTTCQAGNDCALRGSEDVYVEVTIPYDGLWTFDLCGSTYDTYLFIGTACCANDICSNDDGYCNGSYTLQSVCECLDLVAGVYYVTIEAYGSASCGDFVLNVTPCTPPIGRCCYEVPGAPPQCADNTEAECIALNGTWDDALNCTEHPCPELNCPFPSRDTEDLNDVCDPAVPEIFCGDVLCGVVDPALDRDYYRLTIPTGVCKTLTLNVYGNDTPGQWPFGQGLDPQVRVYNSSCTQLYFDDDGGEGYDSRLVTACLTGGLYYIEVRGFSSSVGPYVISLECADCTCPVTCDQWELCGTPAETEPNNQCPGQIDPFVIDCDDVVFGKVCPGTDRDVYQVVVPPQTVMFLYLYDGATCETRPTTCVRNRILNDQCTQLGTGNTSGWRLTNSGDVPWVLYLDVYALNATCRATYKITATCCDIVNYCEDPIYTGPVYDFSMTVNTCCASNPVPQVYANACAGTPYTSGNDVVFMFILDQPGNLDITALAAGTGDEQVMVFTDCANPMTTCVASADALGSGTTPEVITGLALAPGTYYVSVSYYSTGCGDITLTINSDVPLPVELVGDLVATAGDRAVTLTWVTASETNNDRFEILRDGRVVGTKSGAGTSAERHDYSFVDNGLDNGVTYSYVLRSVDLSGNVAELATVEATPSFSAGAVTEYALHQNFPNPFNPVTSIAFDLVESGFVSLKVYNLMGQEVANVVSADMGAGRHIVNFDASRLSSGVYLYTIETGSFSASRKMLLMK